MEEEIAIMNQRKVWSLVALPENTNILGCRWVYAAKTNDQGKIVRHKARLVAQGYKQIKGESYDETFSPVVNFGIIRLFFALLVNSQHWYNMQCDITGAYLYAPLEEEIYMKQPPGFIKKGQEGQVCRLRKAIYGLHQSGRQWFFQIEKVLLKIGFLKINWSNCVYTFKNEALLLLYVDDFVILTRNEGKLEEMVELLNKYFEIKRLGKTRKLLGVEFEENNGEILIHQHNYIDKVCNAFSKYQYPMSSLPISKGAVFSRAQCPQQDSECSLMAKYPYRSVLGCLSFVANRTRPDLNYAINIFSQFQSNPGLVHWEGLLRLLGYLKYTQHLKLKLTCNEVNLIAYTDADYAANRDDRTSMGGQIIFIDKAPIIWRTFKQKCVSLSTMESEFVAMTEATKEVTWCANVINECIKRNIIDNAHLITPTLLVDNMAAIDFAKSPIENFKTKHIDVKLHFVRQYLYKRKFNLFHVSSKNNLADAFTNSLTKIELKRFKTHILFGKM